MPAAGTNIGRKPTMLGKGDTQTSRLGGEFRDPETEDTYRLWRYDATLIQYKITGWLLVFATAPFIWTNYKIFGPSEEFAMLAAIRVVLLAVSVWVLVLAFARADYRRLDRFAFVAGMLVLGSNVLTMYLVEHIGNLMILQGLMIVTICYVLYPGRLVQIAPALGVFSAAFLVTVLTKSSISATEVPGVVAWALIANSVGFLAARQFARFRRSEYMSIRRAEADVAALEEARTVAEQARLEAESANRAKSAMLANTSHELRTPLNAIIGFSEMIQREMLGPIGNQRYRQYAEDINGSGKHLLSLIDDLLDLSKIEAGKSELHPEWIPVESLITETVRLIDGRMRAKGIVLRLDLSPDLDSLLADERTLRQILINLLTNAVKFSPSGSEVIVSGAMMDDGHACLLVRDQGPGFNPGEIARLMQPFEQSEADPNRPREGWGLGLALVKAMCELNGIGFVLENREAGGACAALKFTPRLARRRKAELKLAASG